jgi:ELWxxDGT repeat protein
MNRRRSPLSTLLLAGLATGASLVAPSPTPAAQEAPPAFSSLPISPAALAAVDGGLLALVPASFEAKSELWEVGLGGTRLLTPRLDETFDRLSLVASKQRGFVLGGRDADFIWAADAAGLVPLAEEELATPLGVRGDRLFLLRHTQDDLAPSKFHVELSVLDGESGDAVIVGPVVDYSVDTSGPAPTTTFAASELTQHRGRFYFAVVGDSGGRGLWTTNGAPGATVRVAPWPASCAVCDHVELASNATQLFLAAGGELWRLDLDANGVFVNGTRLLQAKAVRELVPVGGKKTFFVADTAANGSELWITDGTPSGTKLVRELKVGVLGSDPRSLVRLGSSGTIVAFAATGAPGRQVWRSDGTKAGTKRLTPAQPAGSSVAADAEILSIDGRLLFAGIHAASGERELWRSDGTAAGTAKWLDLNDQPGGSHPGLLTATDTTIYLRAKLATGLSLVSIDRSAVR